MKLGLGRKTIIRSLERRSPTFLWHPTCWFTTFHQEVGSRCVTCPNEPGASTEECAGDPTFVSAGSAAEACLAVGLQVAGDVGRTQHLATDVAGDFALMSDHVGAQTIFGGKS